MGQFIHIPAFADLARGTQSTAFVRQRKLPLPCLVGALRIQRSQSQQLMLDTFFASLAGHPGLQRGASDRAFAQARNKLKPAALTALNAQLLDLAQARGWMPLWHGLRVVAADSSVCQSVG